jgi:Tol biopolymer transport system component/DNA-binding winged helix-turn-helix (wHTH) protein
MPGNLHTHTVISFGPFAADLQIQELRKHGVRLRLPGQSFQILKMLLERPGSLVSREELHAALWPSDTFVDFEKGINAAVKRLREALGDSPDDPKLIETLPKRGYRFIGTITSLPPTPVPPVEYVEGRPSWLKVGAWILAVAVCALITVFAYSKFWHRAESLTFTPVPFTAYDGNETMPAFSPDGSQIAFAWDGDPPPGSKGFDLYIKVVGSEHLLRLTRNPTESLLGIAWSPDGTRIAFRRTHGENTGVYVIPALGGPEKRLRSTRGDVPQLEWMLSRLYRPSASISWSPDGKWIAFTDSLATEDRLSNVNDAQRIFLLSPESLESKQISHADGCIHDGMPAFSHDGKQLAYLCLLDYNNWKNGIYSMAISGGPPRLIATFVGWTAPSGIAWTGDDKKLILSRPLNKAERELAEVTIADGSMRSFSFGQNPVWPAISPRGDKLAFTTSSNQVNIWRKDLLHPQAPAVKLISSTHEQRLPQYSPDGKYIAFASSRGGISEIWMSDADGTHLVQISNFKNSWTGTPRWSPDSKKIAFDSRRSGHPEVYVADISELMPRKLVTNIPEMLVPSWSHDGKWIYFESFTPTHGPLMERIYRCPVDGGSAVQLSLSNQQWALESFDGKTVYFTDESRLGRHVGFAKISEPLVANESIVEGMPSMWSTDVWTVAEGGIYFAPEDSPRSIRYFDFNTKHVRKIFDVEKDFDPGGGLSVSPDGHWILYSQVDERGADILLVENFR